MENRFRFRAYDYKKEEYITKDGETPYIFTVDDLADGLIFKPNTVIIEQSTNHNDANGNEVFEGDIVDYDKIAYEIFWDDNAFSYRGGLRKKGIEFDTLVEKGIVSGNAHDTLFLE